MLAGIGLDEFEFIIKEKIIIGFCDVIIICTAKQRMHPCNGNYVAIVETSLIVPIYTMLEFYDADFVAGFEFCQ